MIIPIKQFWDVFKETAGALSTAEALAIMNIAALAKEGVYIELGTHKGKSAMAALVSLKGYSGVGNPPIFHLVDPIFEDVELANKVALDIKAATGTKVRLGVLPEYSTSVIDRFDQYSYVFLDSGSHGDGLPLQEVKMLEDRMCVGGILCFHDYKNQFTEVEMAYDYLVRTGKYEPINIDWQEIFDYVKYRNLEQGNNSWHLYPELPHPPNFVGALIRK